MKMVNLGNAGPLVSRVGLGCMGMSGMYGPADESESLATIHAALDAGINLLDTGDFYGMGHNEMLIRRAITDVPRESFLLSVKFGAQRSPQGAFLGVDTRPAAMKNSLAYSLQRLGTDYIDIYRPARLDPNVPIEETVGAISEMVHAGYVRYIGLSEVSADTVRRANAVHPIVDLQIEYSVINRGPENAILPGMRDLGVGVTAYGVLSRGLISDTPAGGENVAASDFRAHLPRFVGANREMNLVLVRALQTIASEKGIAVAQLSIAWVLSKGEDIVPLIGARRRDRLADALGAIDVTLSDEDLARIERAVPPGSVAGDRYAPDQMAALDSERDPGAGSRQF